MKSVRRLLGLWWISWFGIIGGFLMVGVGDYKHESPAASHFSITLMTVTVLLWVVFFIADDQARKRTDGERSRTVVVALLTLTGTFLAVFTLLGIGFSSLSRRASREQAPKHPNCDEKSPQYSSSSAPG